MRLFLLSWTDPGNGQDGNYLFELEARFATYLKSGGWTGKGLSYDSELEAQYVYRAAPENVRPPFRFAPERKIASRLSFLKKMDTNNQAGISANTRYQKYYQK